MGEEGKIPALRDEILKLIKDEDSSDAYEATMLVIHQILGTEQFARLVLGGKYQK
jgi:hypothetical protein